jgi:hypothetical protein
MIRNHITILLYYKNYLFKNYLFKNVKVFYTFVHVTRQINEEKFGYVKCIAFLELTTIYKKKNIIKGLHI